MTLSSRIINANKLQTIAQLISGALKGATSIKISEDLEYFPDELFNLADTLEYLDLSSNRLSSLPNDFNRFTKLKIFFASDNLFTTYPAVLGNCNELEIVGFKSNSIEFISEDSLNPNLRWLILTNNKIKELPKTIGNCSKIQKLMLGGNKLTSLPEDLKNCSNLALLRISANELEKLPNWLLELPNLAWLAFAGNRIENDFVFADLPEIAIEDISLKEILGAGASGTIYRAERLVGDDVLELAVKIFKGDVTSDGYPEDEMKANIASGLHPSLVKLVGKINLVNEQKKGLVMELIPKSYFNLGLPPTLATCTRDVFDNSLRLSSSQILSVVNSMASVGTHLHSRGIMHGDLYAHNILIDYHGRTLFGDFGAATMYDLKQATQSFYLERIEVKAFGFLLDDLISISDTNGSLTGGEIKKLRDQCLSPDPKERPSFREIMKITEALKN